MGTEQVIRTTIELKWWNGGVLWIELNAITNVNQRHYLTLSCMFLLVYYAKNTLQSKQKFSIFTYKMVTVQ